MLGPLPLLYRLVVSAAALGACAGLGAWVAEILSGPLLASTGAGVGAGFGVVAGLLLTHEPTPTTQPARHRPAHRTSHRR